MERSRWRHTAEPRTTGTVPEYYSEDHSYNLDPDGTFHPLAARPGPHDYVSNYRDLPSGRRTFWRIGVRKDAITNAIDDGPSDPIFHVDAATAELLPGPR